MQEATVRDRQGAFHQKEVEFLQNTTSYPHRPATVELIQTHVSSLFLAGPFVYKVKRPVNLGFLDYTSLAKRRYYCHKEVKLNTRLAPDVYLGVVAIRAKNEELHLDETGGEGEIVDYAVKMRRLPSDSCLESQLKSGSVSCNDVRRLGQLVAGFHRKARTSRSIIRQGGLPSVRRNVEENFRQTRQYIGTALDADVYDDIVAYSRAFLETRKATFQRRAESGAVREGHGDLKASDIYIVDGQIKILDSIEFNRRFRYGDVAADIAFLAMDLDFHGRQDLSDSFVQAYVEASGDEDVWGLLDFFKAYRAYVRAKVNTFRLDEPDISPREERKTLQKARAYYRLAHSYTCVFPRPALIVVSGLMGTGKSAISEELARRWNARHISSDVTRKTRAGIGVTEHRYEEYGRGMYSKEMSTETYAAMADEARRGLEGGHIVILDATYRRARDRRDAVEMAAKLGVEVRVVECVAPERVLRQRVRQRTRTGVSESDARWELYRQQKAEWEPVTEVSGIERIQLDTRRPLKQTTQALLYRLFRSVLTARG